MPMIPSCSTFRVDTPLTSLSVTTATSAYSERVLGSKKLGK
ncbi:MAG: hypothetical protein ABW045_10315 [Gaiellaceae bacterium]